MPRWTNESSLWLFSSRILFCCVVLLGTQINQPVRCNAKETELSHRVTASSDNSKLNVVFILADDLGWGDVGCYGQEKIPTPNIDRLAKQGMRFTQHYSGAPVCAPSRCVLMTGKHLGHAEIRGNQQAKIKFPQFKEGQHPIRSEAVTIAELLHEAGYQTAAFGKWGLGPVGSTGDPNRQGFDLFFGYNCQAVAHSYYPEKLWRNDQQIKINRPGKPGNRKQPEGPVGMEEWIGENYAPKLMIEEAMKFLEGPKESPFFLYLPFIEPHVAMHPPIESVNRFPVEWDTEVYRGESSYLPHPRPRAAYAAMISDLDSYVGQVLNKLDDLKIADRTLVIFSSDNGATHEGPPGTKFHIGGADPKFFNSTANLRGYKGSVYEGGIRVPLIARLPGVIASGTTSDSPSYFADWLPTLCQATNTTPPSDLDGENLWPILTQQASPSERKPMVWVFPEYGGQLAVRFGDFKLVRQGVNRPKVSKWELYNIAMDPSESRDISEQLPEKVQEGIAILKRETTENEIFSMAIPQ